tara:strand:+ start:368 stop:2794 length:2427 start_codon:yes stop_codon:yes gene_type:complete
MATLDNVNLFAPKDPETGKTYELFDAEAIKQKQRQQKQQRDKAARVLAEELEAGNIKKAYEEGFTQLPILEQLLYYINPVTGVPIETYETGYFTKEGGLGIKTPREMLVDAIDPRKNIFQKSFLKADDPLSAAIAPLSALGAAGGVFELANIPKAGLMALRRFQQKTMDGGGGGIGGLPPTTLDEDVNKFARYGDFVSPTIEALIRNAPKNIKGKQIIEYLNSKGAPSAGIKPKELPYLGIERFIEENPNATLPEVIEHAAKNKVQVGEVVYRDIGTKGSDFYFDRSTPEFDPKSGEIIYQHIIDDIVYDVKNKQGAYVDDILESYVQRLTPDELINDYGYVDPNDFTVDDMINRINKSVESGASTETLEDIIEEKARDIYFLNPYKLIKPEGEGFTGGDMTFAFGNSEIGYQNFIDGERIDIKDYGYDDVAYSATEAEVRLQRILEEREDIDIGMYAGNQKYKTYVDETLPGGKNYTEKVYTFENTDEFAPPLGHYDEDTQIAHKLGRDRLLEDGTLSVHADEIQSDFHKEGKRKGYKDPEQDVDDVIKLGRMSSKISMEFKALKDKVLPVLDESSIDRGRLANIETLVANAEELYGQSPQSRRAIIALSNARGNMYDGLVVANKDPNHKFFNFSNFDEAFSPAYELAMIRENRVPNFPFKGDDYGEMVLKQMILDAIYEGKDAISVSTSTPILARYEMTPGSDEAQFFERFYDSTLPKSMNKIAKKYGGKFEKGSLDLEDTLGEMAISTTFAGNPRDEIVKANILRITPEMKAKIKKEGLPLFNMGGKVTKRKFMDKPIEGNRREM